MSEQRGLFWHDLSGFGSAPALVDNRSGAILTYRQLAAATAQIAEGLRGSRKQLALIPLGNNVEDIVRYLGVLAAGHAVCLYNSHTADDVLAGFIRRYRPELTAGRANLIAPASGQAPLQSPCEGFAAWPCREAMDVHPALTLLLSTSGTTGPGRFVRLSSASVAAAADQVCRVLNIGPQDVAITSLPLTYVYGLTVLHSHLAAGATIAVEARSVVEKPFWQAVRDHRVTNFAGVPWTYQLLRQSGVALAGYPRLRTFTTSGGRMPRPLRAWLEETLLPTGKRLYYMYGQTEACGRIAVLPPDLIATKSGSAGRVVAGGAVAVAGDGTLLFSGPNVMMGYADNRRDLSRGDDLGQVLDTGDLGSIDGDGCILLAGRRKRIAKIYGLRVNLDEAQAWLQDENLDAVISEIGEDRLLLRYAPTDAVRIRQAAMALARRLGIPLATLTFERANALPRAASGKLLLSEPRRLELS